MLSPRKAPIAVLGLVAVLLSISIASATLNQVTTLFTIDDLNPSSLTNPVDDECPVGLPCKVKSDLNVEDNNQPAASVTTISPIGFQGIGGIPIPNDAVVGNTHIVVKYAATGGCSSPFKLTIDEIDDFVDGGIKGEVSDDGSAEALGNPGVWPTRLESDLRVSYLRSTGHPVLRRSVAVITYTLFSIPVNLLSFDVSDGNGFAGLTLRGTYNVAVVGDPSPLTTFTGAMCTPMSSNSILLGETSADLLLQKCAMPGIHTMTTVLTREVASALVIDANASDTIDCAMVVGGIAEYPDVPEAAGKSSSPSAGALACAAVAGAILLVAGAWYAGRRRAG